MSEPEITIAGAGPAGLAAAIVLAGAGRRVVVKEWHDRVGRRFHGDFQGLENWSEDQDALDELAGAGIDADFEYHAVSRGTVFDTRGRAHEIAASGPLFYMLRRGSDEGTLDRALMAQARAAGAEIRFGARVDRAEGLTILATGPRRADVIAVGFLFDTELADGAWLALDDDLAPGGYAYLLVAGGCGTLATCQFRNLKNQADCLKRTVNFFTDQLRLAMAHPKPFGGFGNWCVAPTVLQGGHPLVGERAGFQDPLAGFGIRYAIRSGILVARSLLEGRSYENLCRNMMRPAMARAVIDRGVFETTPAWLIDRSVARLAHGDARRHLNHLYRPGLVSRVVAPALARLSRDPLAASACGGDGCGCNRCKCARPHVAPRASDYTTAIAGQALHVTAGMHGEVPVPH